MSKVTLPPESVSQIFNAIGVVPLFEGQEPGDYHLDKYLKVAPPDDPLAQIILSQREMSSKPGLGSVAGHMTAPSGELIDKIPLQLRQTDESGRVELEFGPKKKTWFLMSFEGLYFVITQNHEDPEPHLWLMDTSHPNWNEFKSYFPTNKTETRKIPLLGIQRLLELRKELFLDATVAKEGDHDGTYILHGVLVKVHITPGNLEVTLPGGKADARKLGIKDDFPSEDLIAQIPVVEIPGGSVDATREMFDRLIAGETDFKLVKAGEITGPSGISIIYQAGPFVVISPPQDDPSLQVLEVLRYQSNAKEFIEHWNDQGINRSVVSLVATPQNEMYLTSPELDEQTRQKAAHFFKKMDLTRHFEVLISMPTQGLRITKGATPDDLTLQIKVSRPLLHIFQLIPPGINNIKLAVLLGEIIPYDPLKAVAFLEAQRDTPRFASFESDHFFVLQAQQGAVVLKRKAGEDFLSIGYLSATPKKIVDTLFNELEAKNQDRDQIRKILYDDQLIFYPVNQVDESGIAFIETQFGPVGLMLSPDGAYSQLNVESDPRYLEYFFHSINRDWFNFIDQKSPDVWDVKITESNGKTNTYKGVVFAGEDGSIGILASAAIDPKVLGKYKNELVFFKLSPDFFAKHQDIDDRRILNWKRTEFDAFAFNTDYGIVTKNGDPIDGGIFKLDGFSIHRSPKPIAKGLPTHGQWVLQSRALQKSEATEPLALGPRKIVTKFVEKQSGFFPTFYQFGNLLFYSLEGIPGFPAVPMLIKANEVEAVKKKVGDLIARHGLKRNKDGNFPVSVKLVDELKGIVDESSIVNSVFPPSQKPLVSQLLESLTFEKRDRGTYLVIKNPEVFRKLGYDLDFPNTPIFENPIIYSDLVLPQVHSSIFPDETNASFRLIQFENHFFLYEVKKPQPGATETRTSFWYLAGDGKLIRQMKEFFTKDPYAFRKLDEASTTEFLELLQKISAPCLNKGDFGGTMRFAIPEGEVVLKLGQGEDRNDVRKLKLEVKIKNDPLPEAPPVPLLLKRTFKSGTLVHQSKGTRASWFLMGYQGLFFLVSDVVSQKHENPGPKLWLLDARDRETWSNFFNMFPLEPQFIENLPDHLVQPFVGLKNKLYKNVTSEQMKDDADIYALDGVRVKVHMSLASRTQKYEDVRIEIPGGMAAAEKLGVRGHSPSEDLVAQIPVVEIPGVRADDQLIHTLQKIKDVNGVLFQLTIYQAGPFVVVYNNNTSVFEIFRNQTDAQKCVEHFSKQGQALNDILEQKRKSTKGLRKYFDDSLLLLVPATDGRYLPVSDLPPAERNEYDQMIARADKTNNVAYSANFPKNSIQIINVDGEWQLKVTETDEVKRIFSGVFKNQSAHTLFDPAWFDAVKKRGDPFYFEMVDQKGEHHPVLMLKSVKKDSFDNDFYAFVFFDRAQQKTRVVFMVIDPLVGSSSNSQQKLWAFLVKDALTAMGHPSHATDEARFYEALSTDPTILDMDDIIHGKSPSLILNPWQGAPKIEGNFLVIEAENLFAQAKKMSPVIENFKISFLLNAVPKLESPREKRQVVDPNPLKIVDPKPELTPLPPLPPKPSAVFMAKIQALNELRKGLKNLPLDLSDWVQKRLVALKSPFTLGLQIRLEKNGVPQSKIGTVRDFKRQSFSDEKPVYTLAIKWGFNSDPVTYAVTPKGDDFILTPISTFDYPDSIQLSFVRKEDGSSQAFLRLDAGSALFKFLDESIYGPYQEWKVEDVEGKSLEDLEAMVQAYEARIKTKREPLWRAPVKQAEPPPPVGATPQPAPLVKKFIVDLTQGKTLTLNTTIFDDRIVIDTYQVDPSDKYVLQWNDVPFKPKTVLVNEGILSMVLDTPSVFRDYEIRLVREGDSLKATLTRHREIKIADLVQSHEVTTKVDMGSREKNDALFLVMKTYRHPVSRQQIIAECYLQISDGEAGALKIPVNIKPATISGDHQLVTFSVGGIIGNISYLLEWHEDGSITAMREKTESVLDFDAENSALKIMTGTGEMSLPLYIEDHRFFLRKEALKKFTALQTLLGNDELVKGEPLVEVIPGDEVRLNPVNPVREFIPLTEVKLSDPAVSLIRDALYGPLWNATHGVLPSTGLNLSPAPQTNPEPLLEELTFKPGEVLIPTIKTVRMIADSAYRIMTPSGVKQGLALVEDSPYEYELLAPDSGWVLRIPVLWDPTRIKGPWVLDTGRPVMAYRAGHDPKESQTLSDPRFVVVDNGGDWQIFLLEVSGDKIKRFQINAVVSEKAPLFVGGAQVLNGKKESPAGFKKEAIAEAGEKRDQIVAHVLSQTQTPEEFFHFTRQDIKKGNKNAMEFRFQSTGLQNHWALVTGITWDPTGKRIVFEGPVTLTIKKHPDDERSVEEIKLVPVKIPEGKDEVIYFTEYNPQGHLKGRVFEWFVGQGLLGLRMMLDQKVTESEFLKLLKEKDIPFLDSSRHSAYKPVSRSYNPNALTTIESQIPLLPLNYRGLGYPDPALVTVLKDEDTIKALLAHVHESYLYPTEETLWTQGFVGQKDFEKMIFYGRDLIVEIPMELSGQRYVPTRQTNPNHALQNIRLLIRNPENPNAWFDIPAFVHSHRSSGQDPILRFLIGRSQIPFSLIQQYTRKTLGARPVCGLVAHFSEEDPQTNTRSRAHLVDYLEFMDMDDDARPILPVDFQLGEKIKLPDGRILDLKVVKKGISYHLEGFQFTGAENDPVRPAFINYKTGDNSSFFQLYRAVHGSPLYYLRDKDNKFLLMILDENGKPLFWERKEGIRDFPMAARSTFEMVGLTGEPYQSRATSTAMRLKKNEGKSFEITVTLGRQEGASETSALFASSKALVRFEASVDVDGKLMIPKQGKIKKRGKGEEWKEAVIDWFEDATGKIKIFFKRERRDGYHDYAWVEFENKNDVLGEHFKVTGAHYNRTNWKDKHIMPEDAGFLGLWFGGAAVYAPYASLVSQLSEGDQALLKDQHQNNRDGYALVQAMLEGLGLAPHHPHWDLYFSSFLFKDLPSRQEITLYHWPEGLRLRLLSLPDAEIFSSLKKLAKFQAPLSLTEVKQLRRNIQKSKGHENPFLDLLEDEIDLWITALDHFKEALHFQERELKEQAHNRMVKALNIFEALDHEEGVYEIREWLKGNGYLKNASPVHPRVLDVKEVIVKTQEDEVPLPKSSSPTPDLKDPLVPFLPGTRDFPPWLRLPLYEFMVKKADEKGCSVGETFYPDNQWAYAGKGKHIITLQMGNLFAQKGQNMPSILGMVTKEDWKQIEPSINRYIDDHQSDLLAKPDVRGQLAKDLFELFKVLGFWQPRLLTYVRETKGEEYDQIILGYLKEVVSVVGLKETIKDHLEAIFKFKEDFKQTQTPLAIVAKRKALGVPIEPHISRRSDKNTSYEYDRFSPNSGVTKTPSTTNDGSKDPKAFYEGMIEGVVRFMNPTDMQTKPVFNTLTDGALALKPELIEEELSFTAETQLRLVEVDDGDGSDEMQATPVPADIVPLVASNITMGLPVPYLSLVR